MRVNPLAAAQPWRLPGALGSAPGWEDDTARWKGEAHVLT